MTTTTNTQRGTRAWSQLRTTWQNIIDTNGWTCRRCNQPIQPNQPWDLGHLHDAALGGTAAGAQPEHAHCNRSAGATAGNHRRTHRPTPATPSRPW